MDERATPADDETTPDGLPTVPDADGGLVEAVGKASEALEYVERARGHLYAFHQLSGRADFLFGDAAAQLRELGQDAEADALETDIVGRNVLDGRWTFQVIEEYDEQYYEPVRGAVRDLEAAHTGGRRHVFEARLKQERRSPGRAGHEATPPTH